MILAVVWAVSGITYLVLNLDGLAALCDPDAAGGRLRRDRGVKPQPVCSPSDPFGRIMLAATPGH